MNLLNSTTTTTALTMTPPPSFNLDRSSGATSVLTIFGQTLLTYLTFFVIMYSIARCLRSQCELFFGPRRHPGESRHRPDLEQGSGGGNGGGGGLAVRALPRESSIPYRQQHLGELSRPNNGEVEMELIVRTSLFETASVVVRYAEEINEDGDRKLGLCGECVICLEKFKHGDGCRVLVGCKHSYHKSCIDEWFTKDRHCPLCRATVPGLLVARISRDDQV